MCLVKTQHILVSASLFVKVIHKNEATKTTADECSDGQYNYFGNISQIKVDGNPQRVYNHGHGDNILW